MLIKSEGFQSIGNVVGNLWGGGVGRYTAERLTNKDKALLIEDIGKKLVSGALDSGMGYESLVYADIVIIENQSITVDGKIFTREERESYVFIVKNRLTKHFEDFLDNNDESIVVYV